MIDNEEQLIKSDQSLFKNRINHRSEATQEIISRRPNFIEKWALIIFLAILVMLLCATWFIKYPDVIQAEATLTAINAPKEIVTRQDGKLERLFVANDDIVKQGQILAWIESTASHKQVLLLSELIDSSIIYLALNNTEKVSVLFNKGFYDLGDIQPSYQEFIAAWQQFSDYLINGFYYKIKYSLFQDLVYLRRIHRSLDQQRKLTLMDLKLTQEGFDANSSLFDDKIISKQELRDQRSKLVGKELSIPQLEASQLINENAQAAKQKEIKELEHTISQQKIIFQQALETLKSAVDSWKRKYLITAPVDGKVVFIAPLQQKQYLQINKTIGFINPLDSRYYAQVNLPQFNFGKVDTGLKVQLRFDAYPYEEFGFVEGSLSYISKVPSDSGFLANIRLPKGLFTSYKKELQYRIGLKSQALIITQESRLFQRFYYSIIRMLKDKN